MGQYADDVIDGIVDGETGEIIDGEAPGYPRSTSLPDSPAERIERLTREAASEGLGVRKCSDTHYQICDELGPLVDVWPTTNKYRSCNAKPAASALSGGARKAVKQALFVARKRPEGCEPAEPPPAAKANGCQTQPDAVNHPQHYKLGGMEVIDAIEGLGLGFHAGNVVKYVARYKAKGGAEDLRKARWYLERLIDLEAAQAAKA